MSKKALFILLIISLAFNIAILFSIARLHFVASKINCETADGCKSIYQIVIEKVHPLRKGFHKNRENFMQMVVNPEISDEELFNKLDEMLNSQTEMERELGKNIIEMRKEMKPKELQRFLKMRKNREMRRRK